MSNNLHIVLIASAAGFTALLCYRAFTRRRLPALLAAVALAAIAAWIAITLAPGATQTRGTTEEVVSVVLCYLSMVTGMLAEYAYAQAERGERRLKFDLMSFLMPVFASPIIFIPLLTIATDVAAGGAFTRARLMIYLVAFQNGFFWKGVFEQSRSRLASLPPRAEAFGDRFEQRVGVDRLLQDARKVARVEIRGIAPGDDDHRDVPRVGVRGDLAMDVEPAESGQR